MRHSERGFYLLASIIGYFVLSFVFIGVLVNYFDTQQFKSGVILIKISFLILIWFYIKVVHEKLNGIGWKDYFSLNIMDIPKFAVGMAIPVILTFISLAILIRFNSTVEYYFTDRITSARFLINNLLIGYSEELFFRCFIFFSLLIWTKRVFLSAAISSIFFAILHIGSITDGSFIVTFMNGFIGGMVLSYLYYFTNSIWTAIGFHTLNNTLAQIIEYPQHIQLYADTNLLIIYTGFLIILLAACVFAAMRFKHIRRNLS